MMLSLLPTSYNRHICTNTTQTPLNARTRRQCSQRALLGRRKVKLQIGQLS